MSALGNLLLGLATVAALVSIAALIWGDRMGEKAGESITNTGYIAAFAMFGCLTVATLLMLVAFLTENFSLLYVVNNHTTDVSSLRWLYQVSGVWAGREGSLLFWAWLLSGFIAYVAWKRVEVTDRLSNVSIAVANGIQIFFLVAMFIESNNPFRPTPAEYIGTNGELLVNAGMNPLLQHWAMILHPPTLFIGYAGLAIPFAFALGALIVNDGSKAWVELSDRITVFSWLFLGIGIGLGAIWAYVVLGWGGYWAWDPVENASLLPWLTGVGLLHSFTVYRRRDGFKKWAVWLSAVSFVLVLLGTFITRSGILQKVSVHSFEPDALSFWWFLAMMVGSIVVTALLLAWRSGTFSSRDEFESLLSKESSYYFNNVIMLIASLLVAYMTMAAALPVLFSVGSFSFPPGAGQSFGPANYDAIARPVGILYILIMAVCPILSWRQTEPATFWSRVKFPLVGTAVLSALLMVVYWTVLLPNYTAGAGKQPMVDQVVAIVGLVVAALAISLPIYLFFDGARKRAAAKGEGFGTALLNIMTKARTQSGGYLTHLGMGVILIGLVGSTIFVKDVKASVDQKPGSSFRAGGYEFVFQGIQSEQQRNGDQIAGARFDVRKGGRTVQTIQPNMTIPASNPDQRKLNVDIIYEPLRDVFVVFQGLEEDQTVSMNVKVNPLISFAWVGFLLTCVGTVLAVWPRRRAA